MNLNRLIIVFLLVFGGAYIKALSGLPAIIFYGYALISCLWLTWLVLSAIEEYRILFQDKSEKEDAA